MGVGYIILLCDLINEKIELCICYVNEEIDISDSEIFSISVDYIIKFDFDWVVIILLEYLCEIYIVVD